MDSIPDRRGGRLWNRLLFPAALDSAATAAAFLLVRPPPDDDVLLLCRLLGFLFLTHAPFLILAAQRPARYGGLALAPLLGRLLSAGAWLWLLGSGRLPAAGGVLLGLAAHDAVWPPLFAAFLWTRRANRPLTGAASLAPALPATPPVPPA